VWFRATPQGKSDAMVGILSYHTLASSLADDDVSLPTGESHDETVVLHRCKAIRLTTIFTMLSTLLVALASRLTIMDSSTASRFQTARLGFQHGIPVSDVMLLFDNEVKCGSLETDIDLWTGKSLHAISGVNSAENCGAKCEGEPQCGAFTWGARRHVKGLTDVCFLKQLPEGHTPKRHSKEGVVSGLPCRSSKPEGVQASHEKCKSMDEDTDYWAGSLIRPALSGITQAKVCRSKCEANPKCGAWTWGKKRDVPGLSDVCFLKNLKPDEGLNKHRKRGVVSGLPCVTASVPPPKTGFGCGIVEDGIDYQTSEALHQIINVATAEMCLLKCEQNPKCGAWTWGKHAVSGHIVGGLNDVCFLKGLTQGEAPTKHFKGGVASGIPCRLASWVESTDAETSGQQSPTLFCFALMLPNSYEVGLLAMQHGLKASLFSCDAFKIYSNLSMQVVPGVMTGVVDSNLTCSKGGEFGTVLNTEIFMAVWRKVIEDGLYLDSSWTVKVDPDAVFFPARLRRVLTVHAEAPQGVYLNNCWRGMHGPLEVFSRNAVKAWGAGAKRCVRYFTKKCNGTCQWGEDMFIDQCLWRVLKVRRDNVYDVLIEDHCDAPEGWRECKQKAISAFHPFKSRRDYADCLANADPASADAIKAAAEALTTAKEIESEAETDDSALVGGASQSLPAASVGNVESGSLPAPTAAAAAEGAEAAAAEQYAPDVGEATAEDQTPQAANVIVTSAAPQTAQSVPAALATGATMSQVEPTAAPVAEQVSLTPSATSVAEQATVTGAPASSLAPAMSPVVEEGSDAVANEPSSVYAAPEQTVPST